MRVYHRLKAWSLHAWVKNLIKVYLIILFVDDENNYISLNDLLQNSMFSPMVWCKFRILLSCLYPLKGTESE